MNFELQLSTTHTSTFLIDSFEKENFIDALSLCLSDLSAENICIVADTNINDIYMNLLSETSQLPLDEILYNQGYNVHKVVLSSGESEKSLENLTYILDVLIENNFSKNDILIAFGGGVIGDICGLCASIYKRGMKFINIPTTLLSMIDSCLGGKTAINFKNTKNILGSIYQPSFVIINTNFLKTLDENEIVSASGEIIKYFNLYEYLLISHKESIKKQDFIFEDEKIYLPFHIDEQTNFIHLIRNCLIIKEMFVRLDPLDTDIRNFLNFGHTLGHVFEALSNYEISHGKSVLLGMYFASKISFSMGLIEKSTFEKFKTATTLLTLPLNISYDKNEVEALLLNDKKTIGNKIKMILPHKDLGLIKKELDLKYLLNIIYK